jgi:hypothetical protein
VDAPGIDAQLITRFDSNTVAERQGELEDADVLGA